MDADQFDHAMVALKEQFDLDDIAVGLLRNAASEAAEEFAWQKHREAQR